MHCRSFDDRDVCTVRKIDARIAGDAMMVAGACARRQAATAGASSSATRQPAHGSRSISRETALGVIAPGRPPQPRQRKVDRARYACGKSLEMGPIMRPCLARLCGHH